MDKFYLDEKKYHTHIKYDNDKIKPNDEIKRQIKGIKEYDNFEFKNDSYKFKGLKGDKYNDKYKIKEKGDNKLNNWIMKQTEPLIVFISDIIPDTKVLPHLEKIRPIIKTTPLMSIEEYRKTKKIGEEGTLYLKRLKEKYGNIILKVLWASVNLH
uniref:Uncharacterized protein n=1 Tax=viral metagenome TaxID=1070528 RepID=A0A6C0ESW9_9ZZZZ